MACILLYPMSSGIILCYERNRIMRTRIITITAVMGLVAPLGTVERFAARAGFGRGAQTAATAGTTTATQTVRPTGSQRRDGTFLTSGTTANGSKVRPNTGSGLGDGSCLTTTTPTTPTTPK